MTTKLHTHTITGSELANLLIANIDTGTEDILNPHAWPVSAAFGVSYTLHDCQFPQVEHNVTTVYFDSVSELIEWLKEKREWVAGTDFDFSMTYSVYEWDWGPCYKYTRTI